MNRPMRAIVVEDDPAWQQILREVLEDNGLEVDLTSSYAEALAKLRESPHRLAVLDLSLGGTDHHNQDGLRVGEMIHRYDPQCAMMFLTGFATVELAVKVMREQYALTCLRKETFRRSEFRKLVREALARVPAIGHGQDPSSKGNGIETIGVGAEANRSERETGQRDLPGEAASPGLALIVEDDAGWRSLLTEIMEDAGLRVRSSASYVEAIGLLKRERLDLGVIDLSLASSLGNENMDGYRLLAGMRKANVPVVVVSGYVDQVRMEQSIREGLVYACLEKRSFDRKSFRQTIETAVSTGLEDPTLRSLTEREREVLVLLARGLTNKEIASNLSITSNTVKRHIKSLFVKLEVNTRSAASAKAVSMHIDPGAD